MKRDWPFFWDGALASIALGLVMLGVWLRTSPRSETPVAELLIPSKARVVCLLEEMGGGKLADIGSFKDSCPAGYLRVIGLTTEGGRRWGRP